MSYLIRCIRRTGLCREVQGCESSDAKIDVEARLCSLEVESSGWQ